MRITQEVRDYAEAHRIKDVDAALDAGLKEKADEFLKDGGRLYREV